MACAGRVGRSRCRLGQAGHLCGTADAHLLVEHGRGQLARARELTGAARQHHPAPGYLVEAAELEPRAHQLQRLLHPRLDDADQKGRSEEHTSELQSLMRISYAVFCLKKKKKRYTKTKTISIPKQY